jgi:hypothetical protein
MQVYTSIADSVLFIALGRLDQSKLTGIISLRIIDHYILRFACHNRTAHEQQK